MWCSSVCASAFEHDISTVGMDILEETGDLVEYSGWVEDASGCKYQTILLQVIICNYVLNLRRERFPRRSWSSLSSPKTLPVCINSPLLKEVSLKTATFGYGKDLCY